MEHKGVYLMEHKDTKTQRIILDKGKNLLGQSPWQCLLCLILCVSASLRTKKNFVSSCLCVQLKIDSLCVQLNKM